MPVKFLGQNTVIYMQDYLNAASILVLVCRRTTEFERVVEIIETTTLTGTEVGHKLGIKRGRFSANVISVFNEYGELVANDELCRQWFESGVLLYIMMQDDVAADQQAIEFYGYIERFRRVRNNNEGASFDIDIVMTQPSSYDVPVLACPVVNATPDTDGVLFTFSGVAGTTYTFTRLDNMEQVIVTDNPWQAEFAGLTIDTEYTFSLSVQQYGTEPLSCDNIVINTLPSSSIEGYGGVSAEAACDEVFAEQFFYSGTFGIGTILYSDAELTTFATVPAFIRVDGIVYTAAGSTITGVDGPCTPSTTFFAFNYLDECSVEQITYGLGNALPTVIQEGSYPIGTSGEVLGTHEGFNSYIDVEVSGTFTQGTMSLTVNGVFVECVDLNGTPGIYSFATGTYSIDDLITISINSGTCA